MQLEAQDNGSESPDGQIQPPAGHGGRSDAVPASLPSPADAAVPVTPARQLRHTSSTASLSSRVSRAGRKRDPGSEGDDALGVHHSFASFVSRRSIGGAKNEASSATIGSAIVGNGMASRSHSVTSRAHSVQGRAQSLAGRANSLSGPGMSRFRPTESNQVSDNGSSARPRLSSSGLPSLGLPRLRASQAGTPLAAPALATVLPPIGAASGLVVHGAAGSSITPDLAATIKGQDHGHDGDRPPTPVLMASNQEGEGSSARPALVPNDAAIGAAAAQEKRDAVESQEQLAGGSAIQAPAVDGSNLTTRSAVVTSSSSLQQPKVAPEIEVSPATPPTHHAGAVAAAGGVAHAGDLSYGMDVPSSFCGCFGRSRRVL